MWTENNTEGFTLEELNTINEAVEMLQKHIGIVKNSIDDAICDVWAGHTSATDLADAAAAKLGLR